MRNALERNGTRVTVAGVPSHSKTLISQLNIRMLIVFSVSVPIACVPSPAPGGG